MKEFEDIRLYTYNKFKYIIKLYILINRIVTVICFDSRNVFIIFIYPLWFIMMSVLSLLWLPLIIALWVIREVYCLFMVMLHLPIWYYLGHKYNIKIPKIRLISFNLYRR